MEKINQNWNYGDAPFMSNQDALLLVEGDLDQNYHWPKSILASVHFFKRNVKYLCTLGGVKLYNFKKTGKGPFLYGRWHHIYGIT